MTKDMTTEPITNKKPATVASSQVSDILGNKAVFAIEKAFGSLAKFDEFVSKIKKTVLPTTEIIDSIKQYFDEMDYSQWPENQVMLARLRAIADGKLKSTVHDINFMQHEMLESDLVKRGIPDDYLSVPGELTVWRPAHDITCRSLGPLRAEEIYHPNALAMSDY
jgi:hypothetical protein